MRIVKTADLNGPVNYVDHGGVGAPIVLVHGLAGASENWMDVAPALTKIGHVFAVDLGGFGRTPLTATRGCTVAENVDLLDRFLDEVVGEPATLVGNSMGAVISTIEDAEHPEKVSALVLIDQAFPYPEGTPVDPVVEMTFTSYALPNGVDLVAQYIMNTSAEDVVTMGFQLNCHDAGRVSPDLRRAHVALQEERRGMEWSNRALVEAARSLMEFNATTDLQYEAIRRSTAPALLLHGEHDRLIPLVAAQAVAELRPDWEFQVLDGLGHTPQIEDPQRVATAISEWLLRVRHSSGVTA